MCLQTVEGGIWFCPLERAEALRLRRRPQSNATTETTSSLRPLGRIRLDPSGGAEPPHQPHPRIASRGRIQGSGTAIRLAGTPTKGWLGFGGPREPGAADEYAASTRRPSPGRVLAKPGSSHCTTQSAPPLWSAWLARPRTCCRFVRRRLHVGASQEAGVAHAAGSEVPSCALAPVLPRPQPFSAIFPASRPWVNRPFDVVPQGSPGAWRALRPGHPSFGHAPGKTGYRESASEPPGAVYPAARTETADLAFRLDGRGVRASRRAARDIAPGCIELVSQLDEAAEFSARDAASEFSGCDETDDSLAASVGHADKDAHVAEVARLRAEVYEGHQVRRLGRDPKHEREVAQATGRRARRRGLRRGGGRFVMRERCGERGNRERADEEDNSPVCDPACRTKRRHCAFLRPQLVPLKSLETTKEPGL